MNDPQYDWRSDASEDSKRTVVANRFGGTLDYLWYELDNELGGRIQLTDALLITATAPLFSDKKPSFGDVELHQSGTPSVGLCLRVRNAVNWQPKLNVGGRDCYLYQVGHADDKRRFSFEEQWVRARFIPGVSVFVPKRFGGFMVGFNGNGQYSILPPYYEVFTVVETRFDPVWKQTFDLSELAGKNPALANFVYNNTINAQGVWSISTASTELEVVVVTDSQGNKRELCANMLEEVTD